MALAILEYEGAEGDRHRFRAQLGTNRYYAWAVGDGREPDVVEGFRMLSERRQASVLQGPVGHPGRTVLEVPMSYFDRENQHVQLLSFQERDMRGPAASDIVRVPFGSASGAAGPDGLPPIAFAAGTGRAGRRGAAPRVVPFRNERPRVSTAMFIESLAGIGAGILSQVGPALSGLLPAIQGAMPAIQGALTTAGPMLGAAGPMIGQLLSALAPPRGAAPALPPPPGSAAPPPPPAGANGRPPAGATVSPETAQLLADLIVRLMAPPPAGGARPAAPPPPPAGTSQAQAQAFATSARLSHAQIAPALLAALPALMPLLQQVLTPQTIQGVLSIADPNKLIGTVTNGLQGLAQIGLQGQKQEMEHLERINPGTATPDLIQLMEGMSLSTELGRRVQARPLGSGPSYQRVEAVRLDFADLSPQTVAGRPQTCFLADRELAFPLSVETPRPLPRSELRLEVKEAESLKVLFRRSWPVEATSTGRLERVPRLTRDEASRLSPGEEYLVCATLTWKGRRNRRLGSTMTQLITLVTQCAFDRVEQTTEVVPLSDVEADRDFWHKAWQDTFSKEQRKVVLNCKYHFSLDPKARRIAQMETETDTEAASVRHQVGQMRSGLVLSAYALNDLLARFGHPQLGETELAALTSREFRDRFSQAARTQISFRGRPGDSAALWVYPEVKFQPVVLQEASEVNEAGHVVRFAERRVTFPFPVLAHFIGVASQ